MRRFGLTAVLATSVALAAVVASCSSDTSTGEPLGTSASVPDGGSSQTASASLAGGGWTPAVEAASNDQVTVCHTGNGKHYVQLKLNANGARGHLGNPATGKGGHSGDYRVSANTPCPPS